MQTTLLLIAFESPSLLYALFAVLIPIIVHLFNLRRVRKVEFSNTALLKKIKEESSSKKKPVEILILASRILAIILLVLAFARPIFRKNKTELKLQNQVLVYLDNSQSLSFKRPNDGSGFDEAYNLAEGIVSSYPAGTIFRFIENSYSNSIITEFTKESFTDNLTEVNQVNIDRSFSEVLQRKDRQGLRGDVYLISDFQSVEGLERIVEDTLSQYFLTPISGSDYSNISIDTAFLENTFLSGDVTNTLRVRLKRNRESSKLVNLKLYFGDQLSGTAQLDFGEDLFLDYDFEIPKSESKLDEIKLTIDDNGLAFDNDYFLTVNQLEKVRVLEIYGRNSPSFVSSLFSDNELFQFERLNVNALDNQSIETADFILLNQLDLISNQLSSSISNFLNDGKTAVVVPDGNIEISDYSRIGLDVKNDTGERIDLDVPDYENPFFDGVFENNSEKLEMPSATISYRLINEELSYLSFKNGRSFLSRAVSNGNLFFFSSSFSINQASFTNHAIFVPVLYKLALGSKVNLSKLYYYTDSESIFFPLESQNNINIYSLRKGQEFLIPDQRQEDGQLIMEIPKDEISLGHYQVMLDDNVIGRIAFNLPKEESDIHPADMEYLEVLAEQGSVSVLNSDSSGSVGEQLQAQINGVALWKYALLCALFFLFVEIILIRYL